MNSDVDQLKEITVSLDGQDMTGKIAFLKKEDGDTQRIAMLGSDGIAYSYVDITESDGILNARYYTYSGELYMETVLKNETIKILGAYNLVGSSNSRTWGWFDRFESCVEGFVETVQNDAEWTAVFTVGALCCPQYVLAGLAIGCSISASR